MAIPAALAAVGAKALPVFKNIGGKISNLYSQLGSGGSLDALLGFGGGMVNNKALEDYANTLGSNMGKSLEARAEKYDQKLQNQFLEAEPQYLSEANTQLPELQNLIKDIAEQSTETQRGNLRQINANLAMQGVRGGQAAILANRALGQTTRDTQRDINNLVYNEALNRQNSRLNYFGDKSLTPWKTMSSAYGNSMVGANNALSNAQGNVYANAYNTMLKNRSKGNGLFG